MILCIFKDEERRLARLAIEACNTAYGCNLKLDQHSDGKNCVWQVVGDDMLISPNSDRLYTAYITAYVAGMEKALERIALHLRESLAGAIL